VTGYIVFLIVIYLGVQRYDYILFKKSTVAAIKGMNIRLGAKQDRFDKSRVYADNPEFFNRDN